MPKKDTEPADLGPLETLINTAGDHLAGLSTATATMKQEIARATAQAPQLDTLLKDVAEAEAKKAALTQEIAELERKRALADDALNALKAKLLG